jgi:hypothetical protein
MKTNILLKTITVAGAATLTLSACDMHISFGQEGQEQSQGQSQEQDQQGQDSETSANPDETSANPDEAGQNPNEADSASTSNSTTENDGYQGPRIGEDGVELDADGYGKIPADVLEKDIKNAYAKQGTTVDTVDCYADLRILAHRGSQSCTVTAAGKKNYGTVKITSATQSGISYSLEFPRI